MKIGILVGSLRKDSYNRQLANFIISKYGNLASIEIIEIGEFPLFNEDIEDDLPQVILKTRKQVLEKDGIILISPEYNHSIPGVLKNALDWFSRDDMVLRNKPYLLMGGSTGSIGTTRAQAHIRQVLNSGAFNMYSMPGNEFLFARIQDKLDGDGNVINEGSLERLDRKIYEFIDFIKAIEAI